MFFEQGSDIGRVRKSNQDSIVCLQNKYASLFIVADGMGGHKGGEIASKMIINYFSSIFDKFIPASLEEGEQWLKLNFVRLNEIIKSSQKDELESMGSTCVALLVTEEYNIVGNVGDSRAYAQKDEQFIQITEDHTFVNQLYASGNLTKEEVEKHPKRHLLTSAIGIESNFVVDTFRVSKEVDSVLLCSDGLSNIVSDEEMLYLIRNNTPVVPSLIKLANDKGGNDNISAIYVRLK